MEKLMITPSKVSNYGIKIAKDGIKKKCNSNIKPKISKYE